MLFDRLLGIAEAHMPKYRGILARAKIFEFPIIPHEILPREFAKDTDWMEQNFFLPFPVVAVEDKASCIVLFDIGKDQKGTTDRRGFMECMAFNSDISVFRESLNPDEKEKYENPPEESEIWHREGYALVTAGYIEKMTMLNTDKFIGEGAVTQSLVASKRHIKMGNLHKVHPINGPILNVYSALQEIVYFNRPDSFILQESPIKKRKKSRKVDKLLRSFERPKYTILKPGEIRKRMGLPQLGTRNSPITHERRRHDRWLSDVRHRKDEDGNLRELKKIPHGPRAGEYYYLHVDVPATWVGPSESKTKNKHYKVLINK